MKRYRPHILVVIALAVVLSTGWHASLRNALTDLRFTWQSRAAGGNVVVVAIDAPSIDQIGVWPWPRRLHAELLHRLDAARARDVAFDVDFSTPSDPASDEAFVKALREVGGSTILPSFKQPTSNGGPAHVNRPLKPFSNQSWPAVVNVTVESDGLVRRYPVGEKLGDAVMPSMAVVLAGQDANRRPPFLIDFGIRVATIPSVSYFDVLRGDTAALDKLRDKKIIVGATALELGDRFSVPNGKIISGPVLQALAAESILQNRMLHWTSDVGMIAGLGLICLLMMYSWRRFAPGIRVAILVAAGASVELIATFVQARWPLIIDTSLFHIAVIVYLTAIALDEIDFRSLLGRIAESRFHRIAMSLGDGLVCTDEEHRITVWNPGASAIFGYMPTEMIGRPFETLCAVPAAGGARPFAMRDAARQALLVPGGAVVVEFEGRRKNGETFPVEASFSGWQGTEGFQYGAILRDISVRKREAERVRYLAEHDALTGLANRNMLHAGLANLMAAAERRRSDVALLVLGLDGFQQINDMLGHSAGDLVLRAVAERLRTEVDGEAIVARLSGDEFAIALDCAETGERIAEFAERIAHAFEAPLVTGTRQHRVRISIGVAVYPDGGRSPDDLLSNGHLALSRAKTTRRGSHVIFESAIRQALENRLTLESELALAADRGEFELFYQPQVRLVDGGLVGAEALIRWRHPERGYVSPGEFMPVVNTSALSERLANWVMETACRQARAWEMSGNGVRVAINLSPSQLHSGDLAHTVAALLEVTGLTPSLLELEVTEDILLHDESRVLDMFKRIQQLGVRVLFDDFGTGYASLSYLKKFPLDGLKIDRSFVLDLLADSDDAAIVGSTIGLSKQLGLTVVAEGIENRATADFLVSMGCEEGQGYFFGRPMPAKAFETQFLASELDAVSAA
ncbi:EAL domain-containing protein [Bradyrhizobium cosmicum]|uniref:Signaling protein containing CHASE2/PAS/GGDEF/EAL domains n=1 Tax=Bradyrhizobium cosmicum TaxID=1404864 RepID=A0AAI8QAL0_9BRAD|nr:EAL domain-containing protein [Bradyrhizobium cosmicum]BAL75382.1 putative signaling protein containing CHASE2/PAS/GGDEF/EAL domains [Bradyrhizobium cosmicum]